MDDTPKTLSRRKALAVGLAGAAGAGGLVLGVRAEETSGLRAPSSPRRQPAVYLPHGGGPWPFVELPFGAPDELAGLAAFLRGLPQLAPAPPRAVLVVSAHWEEPAFTVMTHPQPPLYFDYFGFPDEAYRLTWPAPGAPELAARVLEVVRQAGLPAAEDGARGFDHGTFVPLKLAWPAADVPTLQLSLLRGLDPSAHLALGRALRPLRDEGVFIVGSGMSFHNLRAFGPQAAPWAAAFDGWLREAATAAPAERAQRLAAWARAPSARLSHPREEHLLPLMVVAGAAGDDAGATAYSGTLMGLAISAFRYG